MLAGFSVLPGLQLGLPGTPRCTRRPLHRTSKLLDLTTLRLWSHNSQTLPEVPTDQTIFCEYLSSCRASCPIYSLSIDCLQIDLLPIDCLQVLLNSQLIVVCKCISKLARSRPSNVSLNSFDPGLGLHL